MLQYLVVGGCGFVGFHVSRRLLARGHKVWVLDDLSGYGAEGNLRDLVQVSTLLRHSREDARLETVWRGPMVPLPQKVDRVVWVADAPSRFERMDLQLRGVDCLVRWAARAPRPPRVLVVTPATEHEAADAAAERAAALDIRHIRLREVYGPRMSQRAWVSAILGRIAGGGDVECDPADTRDLLHVEDAVTAIWQAVDADEVPKVVEVRGPDEYWAGDLARLLQRRLGSGATVRPGPKRKVNGHAAPAADCAEALGWKPTRRVAPSIGSVLAWHERGEDLLAAEYDEDR